MRCKAIKNIYFFNVHSVALNYPYFNGREDGVLGDIYLYNSTFTVKDVLDGEESPHGDMVLAHADKIHFVNTEFC